MKHSLGEQFAATPNNFNLIRLLAALAVIYGHASAVTGHGPADWFLQFVGYKFIGGVAVDIFFVLSGFLVTSSAMSSRGLRYYVVSRVLRIYPALIVCVLLLVFVLGPALTTSPDYWSAQTWSYFWHNATAVSTEYYLPGVFQQLHDKAINGSLWSLPVEIRLYVLVFALAVLGVLRQRWSYNVLFAIVAIAGIVDENRFASLLPFENQRHAAMMFLIGGFCWLNRDILPLHRHGVLAILLLGWLSRNTPVFGYVYTVGLPYLVFAAALAPGFGWFRRAGDYSYGVYLYGWPAQQLVLVYIPDASNRLDTLLGCALALALAIASWHLIEKRALRVKKWFARAPQAASPGVEAVRPAA